MKQIKVGEVVSGDYIKLNKADPAFVEVQGRMFWTNKPLVKFRIDETWTKELSNDKSVYIRED